MKSERRPNVLIVITDDLTWGDLGCHGNPYAPTPHLDRLHGESTRLVRCYAGPMCTPSRAALMTGRYPYRTGALDTYCGRSMLHHSELTLAQVLRDSGYRTGLFGKWHLGDCYPMRPEDKGFEQTLWHTGGGLRQPGNPTLNNGYFDPDLRRNGEQVKTRGHCTDLFADAAIEFIEKNSSEPFFAYLAFNAPHAPFEVEQKWVEPFLNQGLNETFAKIYGMVANLDFQVGRVLRRLEELKLDSNTIVIFTSDHGWCPSTLVNGEHRFNSGLRDGKGTMYDGGVRVPCLWRWPGRFPRGRDVNCIANPIDMLPTLAALCGVTPPAHVRWDGANLAPLLTGQLPEDAWPERHLFLQWHRGDVPQRWRNCCVITQRFKLVNGRELYDLLADPSETTNVAQAHPQIVSLLRESYERWFDDVSTSRGSGTFAPPRIVLGSVHENPTVLTWQDWRIHGEDGWSPQHAGHWEVEFANEKFEVTLRFESPTDCGGTAHLQFGATHVVQAMNVGQGSCAFSNIAVSLGPGRIEAWLQSADGRLLSPRWIDVRRQQ